MSQHEMLDWLDQYAGKTYGNFIQGEWLASKSGRTVPLYHAARKDQLLGYFADSTEEDVDLAVKAAHEAFKTWSRVPAPERSTMLLTFAGLLERDAKELAYMLSAEQGKTLAESYGEVGRAAKETRFAAGDALRIDGETLPGERAHVWNSTVRYPIGVIAAIAPWNFPVVTPVRKIAPALAYGCTVVIKPASNTPWATVKIMELLAEAGLPRGVVNLVTGSGSRVGDPLVRHPLVRGISFTGSTKQGLTINEIAGGRLARTQLELGGKNPAVVLDYPHLEYAAKQIVSAAFTCSGQRCTAISRVIVLQHQAEALTEAILKEMKQIKIGPAWEQGVNMGPLVSESHLESVRSYIEVGKREGARLRTGGEILTAGKFSNGAYMTPALFDQVTPEMRIAKEEIFGPVLSVIPVKDEQEAFEAANAVDYGLAAAIFTENLSSAYRYADQIESGMVHINHGTASAAHMPFGGVKQSGFGPYSIGSSNKEFFTEMKVLYLQY
ncbi:MULTISPECIES: aldehyde dehydrogenase family protein [unclassified Paenibacillus]|uniref:aldehyde dehydrogenase family protein n=1 Tax=unclassified Paenibacillus TaxID=185978 RepID=UPI002118C09C|nr:MULTISPECIES: aldehyde dehydrogenase family protein [unclassified Paenibacillus]